MFYGKKDFERKLNDSTGNFFGALTFVRRAKSGTVILMPVLMGVIWLGIVYLIPDITFGSGILTTRLLPYIVMELILLEIWFALGYAEKFDNKKAFLPAVLAPAIPLAAAILIGCSDMELIKNVPYLQKAAKCCFYAGYHLIPPRQWSAEEQMLNTALSMERGLMILVKYAISFTLGYVLGARKLKARETE